MVDAQEMPVARGAEVVKFLAASSQWDKNINDEIDWIDRSQITYSPYAS